MSTKQLIQKKKKKAKEYSNLEGVLFGCSFVFLIVLGVTKIFPNIH